MTTSVSPETEAYLGGHGTPDQQALFEAAARLISDVYAARYPNRPEDADGMTMGQVAGAAQYALGDLTLEAAGEAFAQARADYMDASDTLAGVMCAAAEQGMTPSQIAAAAGVTRQIVYKRTEPKL